MTTPNHPQEAGQTPVDEMRKAFEFWFSDEGHYPKAAQRDSNGSYVLMGAAAAWQAWQAAWKCRGEQDALICEAQKTPAAERVDHFYNVGVTTCANAIRNGGSHD